MIRKGFTLIIFLLLIPSFVWAQATTHQEFQSYTFARKAFEDKLYDITIREGQDYIAKFPQGRLKDRVLYLVGLAFYHQGKLSDALLPMQQLKKDYPKSPIYPAALYRLGQIYFELRQYPAAIQEFEILWQKGEPSWREPTLFLLARAYQQAGNYQPAAERFQQLLKIAPQSPKSYEYHLRYGEVLFLLKDYAGAARELRVSLDTFPATDPAKLKGDVAYKLGQALFLSGSYAEGAGVLKSLIEQYPHHKALTDALFLLAEAQEKLKDYTGAILAYSRIIDRFPQSRWYYTALAKRGWFQFNKGDYSASIQDYTRLAQEAQKPPWPILAVYMVGENYWAKNDYASAIKYYSQVIAAKDNKKYLLPAYFKQALCYYLMGNYTGSLAELEALAKLNPGDDIKTESLYLKGQSLFQMGKYTEAIENYQQFLTIRPQDQRISGVLFNLGLARKRQGDIVGAREAWEKVVAQEKDSAQTYWASLQLGFIYYQDSGKEKAIAALTRAAQGPEPLLACEARYWLAELYFQAEDYTRGLQEVEQMFKTKVEGISNPWLGMAYSKAGAIYEKLGDKEKARTAYQNVLQVSQDKELLTVASKRIKVLEAKTP